MDFINLLHWGKKSRFNVVKLDFQKKNKLIKSASASRNLFSELFSESILFQWYCPENTNKLRDLCINEYFHFLNILILSHFLDTYMLESMNFNV